MCWTLSLAGACAPALAAPYAPVDDQTVVQQLPYRLDRSQRAQQADVASGALPLPQALQAAQAAIERSRRFGDPRELGLAQAALAPWWQQPTPPPAVRLLRATVHQSQHSFDAALAELDDLVRPGAQVPLVVQAQAELTRATVLQVTGRLQPAKASCEALLAPRFAPLGAAVTLPAQVCLAELQSLQGQAQAADQALAKLSRGDGQTRPDSWILLVRAELAHRRGDTQLAAVLWPQALGDDAGVYARAAYADWLLDQRRDADVLALLPPDSAAADALALRRAIALHRLHSPQAGAAAQDLRDRFDAARQRGESLHQREEARFLLEVQGDAAGALKLAQQQWQLQKEPADAVLLARAAQAAGAPQALQPLRRFVNDNHWVDGRLALVDRSLQP